MCFILLEVIIYVYVLILAILEIYSGVTYNNSLSNCSNPNSDIHFTLFTWLIVDGSTFIMTSSLSMCARVMQSEIIEVNPRTYNQVWRNTYLFTIFSPVWNIVGGVLFWRDNPVCEPHNLSLILWVALISHYCYQFFIVRRLHEGHKEYNNTRSNNTGLVYVPTTRSIEFHTRV